ncbi:MAG: hypothetical protein ABEJ87_03515 [Candidatus Nanohalobium sp.]
MSAGVGSTDQVSMMSEPEERWGDPEGLTGEEFEDDQYREVFDQIESLLQDATGEVTFQGSEMDAEKALEKYREELEPGEDEFLKGSLSSYETVDGKLRTLEVEKGEIEGYRIVSQGYSHRPVVTTDHPPGEGEKLGSIIEGDSEQYLITWEE